MRATTCFLIVAMAVATGWGAGAWAKDTAEQAPPREQGTEVAANAAKPSVSTAAPNQWWGNRSVSYENYIRFDKVKGRRVCPCDREDYECWKQHCHDPWCQQNCDMCIGMFFFDLDKSFLRPEGKRMGDRVVTFLTLYPHLNVTIEGHCCDWNTDDYNVALGQRRASTVHKYLVDHGIDPARLSTKTYGEFRPWVPNNGHRDLNRRSLVITRAPNRLN